MIEFREGDVTKSGADIICHQTNCRGVMGSGLARQIKMENPEMFHRYVAHCKQVGDRLLGTALILPMDQDLYKKSSDMRYIANCFGQAGYGRDKVYTQYKALESALARVAAFARSYNKRSIAIPYNIGCGLAGGKWDIVESIIRHVLGGPDFDVTIWRYEP